MKEKYIKSIKYKIYDNVVANYKKLDLNNFVMGELPYNYKCHLNAVQKVKEGKAEKVIACITIRKDDWKDIIVHFVNQLEDGKFQDNTWGWVYEEYNYYMVKEVDKSEFGDIGDVLEGLKKSLIKSNSNPAIRKLLRIKSDFI